jgi:translation initiation factor 3 subunit I
MTLAISQTRRGGSLTPSRSTTTSDEIIHPMVFPHRGPVRGVAWADGGQTFATISDHFVDQNGQISIYDVPEDESADTYSDKPRLDIELPKGPDGKRVEATNVVWLSCNEALFVTFDNGSIRLYDPATGEELEEFYPHEKKINRVSFNRDKTLFITASADFTSKLYDVVNLKHLKTYKTDRPVNAAVLSETKDHVSNFPSLECCRRWV